MHPREFLSWVNSDPTLEYDGALKGDTPASDVLYVIVKDPDTGKQRARFKVEFDGLKDATRRDLEGVFRGERLPVVMKHLARIVGYYSFMGSWNKSKLQEAKDRSRGNYGVPEAA